MNEKQNLAKLFLCYILNRFSRGFDDFTAARLRFRVFTLRLLCKGDLKHEIMQIFMILASLKAPGDGVTDFLLRSH